MSNLPAFFKRTSLVATLCVAFLLLSGCVNKNPEQFDISCTLDEVVTLEAVGFGLHIRAGVLSFREGTSWKDPKLTVHNMAPKENCSMVSIDVPEEKAR